MKNSEKYKTAEERASAFKRFCDDMHEKHISGPCPSCPAFGNQCAFRWLDLEAEEKPIDCPFCGRNAVCDSIPGISPNVRCTRCGASIYRDTLVDAIAAWNRRAK